MRLEVIMPRMGQSMDEGRVLSWLVKKGDEVNKGDFIAEIETDKAVVEIESFVTGTLVEIVIAEGELVPTGTVIAYVDDGQPEVEDDSKPETRINASPVAKRMAKEQGVDLARVAGTGPGGRIGKDDVEAWLKNQAQIVEERISQNAPVRIPLSNIKKATARRMSESIRAAPHFYISVDIELDQALALRDWYKNEGQEISINDLILKATAIALTRFPSLNAAYINDEIHRFPNIDLAVAVALDEGLITPVIHNCEKLTLLEIAQAASRIIERARAGRLGQDDLTDGTFTVSNLGMYGVRQFEAIINPPQAAILAVGAIRRMPVFDSFDRLVPRHLITATVSADHRVTDGAEVARFLQQVRMVLENGYDLMSTPAANEKG